MVKVRFDSRLICDIFFYNKHIKRNSDMMFKLMRININSKEHKKNHTVISKKSFDLILKEDPKLAEYPELLMAALKRLSEPENIEEEEDELIRTIEHAINLSSETPFNTLILTTKEKKDEYDKNSRYSKMNKVNTKVDEEALRVINNLYEQAMDKDFQ